MIAIIDYGMGNLGSVAKAFGAIGADVKVTASATDLKNAEKIVLPGVGAFRYCVQSLKKLKLIDALKDNINNGKPYLGLCLGMQILFDDSEEGGNVKGLGILKGKVKKFKSLNRLKVPHMGWNQIKRKAQSEKRKTVECPLLKDIPDGAWMYFVHSYYASPRDKSIIATTTDYGMDFTSMIWKDNIYATQFHPEKSQEFGLQILKNFISIK